VKRFFAPESIQKSTMLAALFVRSHFRPSVRHFGPEQLQQVFKGK